MESKTARFTVLLDPRKKRMFEEICAAQDQTPSQVVRQMMRESLAAVAEGKDPLCIIRDPARQNVDFAQYAPMAGERQDEPAVNYNLGFRQADETVEA